MGNILKIKDHKSWVCLFIMCLGVCFPISLVYGFENNFVTERQQSCLQTKCDSINVVDAVTLEMYKKVYNSFRERDGFKNADALAAYLAQNSALLSLFFDEFVHRDFGDPGYVSVYRLSDVLESVLEKNPALFDSVLNRLVDEENKEIMALLAKPLIDSFSFENVVDHEQVKKLFSVLRRADSRVYPLMSALTGLLGRCLQQDPVRLHDYIKELAIETNRDCVSAAIGNAFQLEMEDNFKEWEKVSVTSDEIAFGYQLLNDIEHSEYLDYVFSVLVTLSAEHVSVEPLIVLLEKAGEKRKDLRTKAAYIRALSRIVEFDTKRNLQVTKDDFARIYKTTVTDVYEETEYVDNDYVRMCFPMLAELQEAYESLYFSAAQYNFMSKVTLSHGSNDMYDRTKEAVDDLLKVTRENNSFIALFDKPEIIPSFIQSAWKHDTLEVQESIADFIHSLYSAEFWTGPYHEYVLTGIEKIPSRKCKEYALSQLQITVIQSLADSQLHVSADDMFAAMMADMLKTDDPLVIDMFENVFAALLQHDLWIFDEFFQSLSNSSASDVQRVLMHAIGTTIVKYPVLTFRLERTIARIEQDEQKRVLQDIFQSFINEAIVRLHEEARENGTSADAFQPANEQLDSIEAVREAYQGAIGKYMKLDFAELDASTRNWMILKGIDDEVRGLLEKVNYSSVEIVFQDIFGAYIHARGMGSFLWEFEKIAAVFDIWRVEYQYAGLHPDTFPLLFDVIERCSFDLNYINEHQDFIDSLLELLGIKFYKKGYPKANTRHKTTAGFQAMGSEKMIQFLDDVISARVSHFFNIIEEVFIAGEFDNDEYVSFRTFLFTHDIDIHLRMRIAEDYIEIISCQRMLKEYFKDNDLTKNFSETIKLGTRTIEKELKEYIASIVDRDKEIKARKQLKGAIKNVLQGMRITFLKCLLGRDITARESAIFSHAKAKQKIVTILSIVSTLKASDSFEEDDLARLLVTYCLDVLISNYDEDDVHSLDKAIRKINTYIMNITHEDIVQLHQSLLKDRQDSDGSDNEHDIEKDFEGRLSNKEVRQRLIKNGYDARLFDEGVEFEIILNQGLSQEDKDNRIQKWAHALVEIVIERLSIHEIHGASLSFNSAQEIVDGDSAKAFIAAVKEACTIDEDIEDDIDNIIDGIERDSALVVGGTVSPRTFTITCKKDFLQEATAGLGVSGCFNPRGIHREMPLVHALEANVMFIQVYADNDKNKQISNAVMVLGEDAAYIYSDYGYSGLNSGEGLAQYDLTPAFVRAVMRLASMVPQIVMRDSSAGGSFFSLIPGSKRTDTIEVVKTAPVFADQYFDEGSVNDETGDLKVTVTAPIILTQEVLEQNKLILDSVVPVKKRSELGKDIEWTDLLQQLDAEHFYKYKFIIGVLKKQIMQGVDLRTMPNFAELLRDSILNGYRGIPEKEEVDMVIKLIEDFFGHARYVVGAESLFYQAA